MRHRVAGRHLGRDTAHRLSLYRNLVTDLLRYERITTTEAKAKEIRPMAEKIITLGRRGDLHARRQALKFVYDPKVVKKVFDDIGPRMSTRPGGYLRITGMEPRKGDGAKMAIIELVDFVDAPPTPRPQRVTAAPTTTARGTAAAAIAPSAAAAAEAEADLTEAEAEEVATAEPEATLEAEATAADSDETTEAEAPAEASATDDEAPATEDGEDKAEA
jgi:large subunit ribosomal protein L17